MTSVRFRFRNGLYAFQGRSRLAPPRGWLRNSVIAGLGRDVLGVPAGEAAAGKMADGKAGEEKPEKPQRAGAAGGEHNPSDAGCVGCSGLSFELPGWGE